MDNVVAKEKLFSAIENKTTLVSIKADWFSASIVMDSPSEDFDEIVFGNSALTIDYTHAKITETNDIYNVILPQMEIVFEVIGE